MRIQKDMVVTLLCALRDVNHALLQDCGRPIIYLHGGYDGIHPALEAVLEGKEVGESAVVELPPEEGYGEYDVALVRDESKADLPGPLDVGSELIGGPVPRYDDEAVIYRVVAIDGDRVLLDGNHRLAGKTLRVECSIADVRPATDEEKRERKPAPQH